MSILVTVHKEHNSHIEITPDSLTAFKLMLSRACNVWPDAPVEIKELHDILVHGELLQDYRSQPKFTRREELAQSENMKLDSWRSENSEAGE
jgi:hypothetical protein